MPRTTLVIACCAMAILSTPAQSAQHGAVRTSISWRQLKKFLPRDLVCTPTHIAPGHGRNQHRLDCIWDNSGLESAEIILSPDQRSVRAVQILGEIWSRDRRVPPRRPRQARRTIVRLVRFMVPDAGQSARWTARAMRRVIRTDRCMQAHHSKGYSLVVLGISPLDYDLAGAEVTIAFGSSANRYLENGCFP
jgi:hypothetical protein